MNGSIPPTAGSGYSGNASSNYLVTLSVACFEGIG